MLCVGLPIKAAPTADGTKGADQGNSAGIDRINLGPEPKLELGITHKPAASSSRNLQGEDEREEGKAPKGPSKPGKKQCVVRFEEPDALQADLSTRQGTSSVEATEAQLPRKGVRFAVPAEEELPSSRLKEDRPVIKGCSGHGDCSQSRQDIVIT